MKRLRKWIIAGWCEEEIAVLIVLFGIAAVLVLGRFLAQ